MPKTIGMKRSAITGRVRAAASQMRRTISPQAPRDMWWSMSSAQAPSATPDHSR